VGDSRLLVISGHVVSNQTRNGRSVPSFQSADWLSIILISLLGVSVFFSEAPVFSAFKVYQLGVMVAFIMRFTERFGIAETLNNLFLGCCILTIADIAAAFLMPDLVFVPSELNTLRFRGDLIAQTGTVSVIGLILLLTIKSDLPRNKFILWAVIFGGVLVFFDSYKLLNIVGIPNTCRSQTSTNTRASKDCYAGSPNCAFCS
jgi:hypothetical protein